VTIDVVNVMAMDYQQGGDYGPKAIQAAQATFSQIKALYPSKTTAQVWRMVGVTPMLGKKRRRWHLRPDRRQEPGLVREDQPPRRVGLLGSHPRPQRLHRRSVHVHEHSPDPVRVQQNLRRLRRLTFMPGPAR